MHCMMICFCRWGSSSMGHSFPRSPAGHHDRSGGVDDARQVLHGRPGLDLGHQHRTARMGLGADAADVVGGAHERDGHHVHAELYEGVEGYEVVGSGRGHPEPVRGYVDAGTARQHAPVRHEGLHAGGVLVDDIEHDPPVAHVEGVAHQHVVEQPLVAHLDHIGRRGVLARDQLHGTAGVELCGGLAKVGGADLGTGKVHEDPDRATLLLGCPADPPGALDGLVDSSMGQADAGHVHARRDHVAQRGLVLAGRADRGDDLGSALHLHNATAHCGLLWKTARLG